MFSNEIISAIVSEIPGFLTIIARYCYDLAMHAIGILSNAL